MFIIPSIDLSMKLSLSEVFVSNIIVTMVISNKSCCKHVLFTNLSDCISTTTRVTSVNYKKFLFCSFSVAKFGIAPFFGTVDTRIFAGCVNLSEKIVILAFQNPGDVIFFGQFSCVFARGDVLYFNSRYVT